MKLLTALPNAHKKFPIRAMQELFDLKTFFWMRTLNIENDLQVITKYIMPMKKLYKAKKKLMGPIGSQSLLCGRFAISDPGSTGVGGFN